MNMPALPCPYVKATENKEDTMSGKKLYQNRDASIRNLWNNFQTATDKTAETCYNMRKWMALM